jgi:hypothetical protein
MGSHRGRAIVTLWLPLRLHRQLDELAEARSLSRGETAAELLAAVLDQRPRATPLPGPARRGPPSRPRLVVLHREKAR